MANNLIPVLTDSREQRPWVLDPTKFATERIGLPTGDYTLRGFEDRVCLERKSLGDLVGTLTADWLRFRKELWRLAGFDIAAIVVEATVDDVWGHRYESEATPQSVMGRVNGLWLDHGVPVLFWGSRTGAVLMAESFLALAWKKMGGSS
jgi:ERCC4-type nuclease